MPGSERCTWQSKNPGVTVLPPDVHLHRLHRLVDLRGTSGRSGVGDLAVVDHDNRVSDRVSTGPVDQASIVKNGCRHNPWLYRVFDLSRHSLFDPAAVHPPAPPASGESDVPTPKSRRNPTSSTYMSRIDVSWSSVPGIGADHTCSNLSSQELEMSRNCLSRRLQIMSYGRDGGAPHLTDRVEYAPTSLCGRAFEQRMSRLGH